MSRIALIETTSFCCGVHSKRYSGEQDRTSFENRISAPEKNYCTLNFSRYSMGFMPTILKNTLRKAFGSLYPVFSIISEIESWVCSKYFLELSTLIFCKYSIGGIPVTCLNRRVMFRALVGISLVISSSFSMVCY